jgi:hypothetical protein
MPPHLPMLLQQTSNSYKKVLRLILTSVIVVFAVLFSFSAKALTLSPARIEINGDPGSTVGGEFTVSNDQTTPQTLYVSYENFNAQGESGAPAFSSEKSGLDTWITVTPPEITIAAGQSVKVPYTITIPKNADAGGYFSAIFLSSAPPSSQTTQVSIGAKVGVLILLRVNGQITESAGVTQFDRNNHGFFYTTLPVDLQYKFSNNGGDRVEPTGTVTVRNTFFIPSARIDANPSEGNILPNSVRMFTVEWLTHPATVPVEGFFNQVTYEWQNFALGLYSAHLDLTYGTANMHTTKTAWFFVFPWQLVLCLLILIGIIGWGGKVVLTRYNRYIIKKALKNQ